MKPPKKKPKLTAAEIKKAATERKEKARKRQHIRAIKDTFVNSGFHHLDKMSKTDFSFKAKGCDFDEVFVLENVLVLVEHTAHNEDHVSKHLVGKSIIFGYINSDPAGFSKYARENFPEIAAALNPKYADHDIQVRIVYSSLNPLKKDTKIHIQSVHFLDFPQLKYFLLLSRAIRLSAKFEVLDFLAVSASQFSSGVFHAGAAKAAPFAGSVLPESQSHLPAGFKVASFYVNAGALIQRAYVLRRDSWREGVNIYQRVLQKKKVDSIRRHLISGKGAFLNNIIVALPNSTRILNDKGDQVDPAKIFKVTPAVVQLTEEFNSVAIIDGQHRVLSYYEGGLDEATISVLREQQNLLVTGVMLPDHLTPAAKDRFSAGLFLQINSNQTNAPPELIQDIGVILRPFSVGSVARRVLWKLNERGPFTDKFQTAFAEGERVKTASVVNYGLVPLVRPGSEDSLFAHWADAAKGDLVKGQSDESIDADVIERYVEFCTKEINKFSGAVKDSVGDHRWTASRKVPDKLLTTTIVNGIVHCLRRLCIAGKLSSNESYRSSLVGLNEFEFSKYTSSHYNEMGVEMAAEFFKV